MEWDRALRRTQSLKSIPSSCDKPTWMDAGLRDKTASVSQLVARYQTTVKKNTIRQSAPGETGDKKTKKGLDEKTSSPLQVPETHLESPMRRSKERDPTQAKSSLPRSKSMGSLQTSTASIEALKAVFEPDPPAQRKVKSSFKTAKVTLSPTADMPMMNGEAVHVQKAAEEQKIPAGNKAKKEAKEDYVNQKLNQNQMEKRKTVAGIDFEKLAESEAEERRRTVADFRDSAFIQTKEILSVSVKAMSALYMSKVVTQDSTNRISKMEQDQTQEFENKAKLTKMEEDSQQKMDDLPSLQPETHETGLEDLSGDPLQQCQLSKQMYQQRQKNELRRLLKHTHPELKTLDDVDKEFADVLSSERATVDDTTGYEGEVLSRRLIFENRGSSVSPYTPKIHMAQGAVGRCDCSKTPTISERSKEEPLVESVTDVMENDNSLDLRLSFNKETEEEVTRVDVKAARSIFESQSGTIVNKIQGNVSNERKTVQKYDKLSETTLRENLHDINRNTNTNFEEKRQKTCGHVSQRTEADFSGRGFHSDEALFEDKFTSSDSESHGEIIKTSASLFQNNPFISTNIEQEHSYGRTSETHNEKSAAGEDCLIANVKDRTHLFESMPFDKIRHQNRDELEMMVEIIKETLTFLYQVKAIQSTGSIIEVNETMIAKKAKFTLSERGPEINYDEVAQGGAQNFILQLLPRVNLKPQITYLKENSKGAMEATMVDVLVHHRQVNPKKNTEFKTANVVQLVEDILNQDNSLRKGVIIQEHANNCAEVIVYSLYKYLDGEEVKSYSPPKSADYTETERDCMTNDKETRTHLTASTTRSPQETTVDQTSSGSIRPNVKVNVKLFTSCIEKGDLEYLKTLQDDEPAVQMNELSPNQAVLEQNDDSLHEQRSNLAQDDDPEYVPMSVQRLKNMFNEDRSPILASCTPSTSISNTSSKKSECNIEAFYHQQPTNNTFKENEDQEAKKHVSHAHDDSVHQDEVAAVLDDTDNVSDCRAAIQNLQVTKEAKLFHRLSQNTEKTCMEESLEKPTNTAGKRFPQEDMDPQVESCNKISLNIPLVSDVALGHELDKHTNTDRCPEDDNPEKIKTTEIRSKKSQEYAETDRKQHVQSTVVSLSSSEKSHAPEEEEVVFQGKLQAALNSLEKSNINVARGDFKAAMIYKNSSKSHQRTSQSDKNPNTKEICPVEEQKSTQVPPNPEVTGTMLKSNTGSVSQKSIRPTGPKPPLPLKPEHLKRKQGDDLLAVTRNPEATQSSTVRTKETVPQDHQSSTTDKKQHLFTSTNMVTDHHTNKVSGNNTLVFQKSEVKNEVQVSTVAFKTDETDKIISNKQLERSATGKENLPQCTSGKDINETDETHVNFHEARHAFEGKKLSLGKTAPVKPKRKKVAHFDNKEPKGLPGGTSRDPPVSAQVDQKTVQSQVKMREKKGQTETEDECRLRLSVHMDEIMRGNITTAMEIFDNLRKQEQLQTILSRVEEIEQDTSGVDVKSLRRAFENVPDWVVSSDSKKQKRVRPENNEKPEQLPVERTESMSSMEHVYGDLARASEEIINLKEQTLARLKDIEVAIKKALCSVSALKSDSDIADLSSLFKESLGHVQGPCSSGNVGEIGLSSNRMKSQEAQQSFITRTNPNAQTAQYASTATPFTKQSPPSSPGCFSVQSAAGAMDKTVPPEMSMKGQTGSKQEERYRATKTLICNSPAQRKETDPRKDGEEQSYGPQNVNRELSVTAVQTDSEGNVIETKAVMENYERTNEFCNKVYTSKTSTILPTEP